MTPSSFTGLDSMREGRVRVLLGHFLFECFEAFGGQFIRRSPECFLQFENRLRWRHHKPVREKISGSVVSPEHELFSWLALLDLLDKFSSRDVNGRSHACCKANRGQCSEQNNLVHKPHRDEPDENPLPYVVSSVPRPEDPWPRLGRLVCFPFFRQQSPDVSLLCWRQLLKTGLNFGVPALFCVLASTHA